MGIAGNTLEMVRAKHSISSATFDEQMRLIRSIRVDRHRIGESGRDVINIRAQYCVSGQSINFVLDFPGDKQTLPPSGRSHRPFYCSK